MASPNISFDSIPSSIRKPGKYAEFNTALAVRTLPGNRQKVLCLGQRLAAGTVVAGQVVDVFSDAEAATYFGRGSIAHRMVRAALRANPYMALQVIAADDAGASVAATNTLTVTGPATVAGVASISVGEDLVEVAYAVADTANVIAAALKAQFDNQPDLGVTATVALGVVTLTAKNKGTVGNHLKFAAKVTANSGVAIAVTQPTNGATDPVAATLLAAVFAAGHDIIVCPWIDQTNLAALRDHLDSVGGPLEKRGAIGTYGWTGTLATGTTLANALNGKRLTYSLVPGAYAPAYEVGAKYAAVIASEEDPARPLNGLPLGGLLAPPLANRLSRTEQENALYNGTTPTEVGPGEVVQIVRAITTYTKDPQGVADISLLDLTTIRSLDYGRKAIVDRLSLRFPRSKRTKRVKAQMREEVLDVMYKLEDLEIWENVKENEDGVLVEDDSQDQNRVNIRIPADVVNGLHVVGIRIDLIL
jgi:phage tail sheath gpL-like